jgi:GTP-binding protein
MTKTRDLPVVAIVGRPNVGKSALFNRLIREPLAIVEDQPGVTRDRIYAECDWNGRDFVLVDTAGLVPQNTRDDEEDFASNILKNARIAVEEADLVMFLVDATAGLHPLEEEIAEMLRRSGKPVLMVANKVDNTKREADIYEFMQLGLGEPMPASAVHGHGTGELLDEVVARLPELEAGEEEASIRLSIVGRPNVGKSSLLNALIGEDRALVDAVPGTTRDAVDTQLRVDSQLYTLIDTAGIRRHAKQEDSVEFYSSVRSHRAIKSCDIALLVLDATQGVNQQDKRVAGYVQEARKGIIVVVNKWDLVKTGDTREDNRWKRHFGEDMGHAFNFMSYAPVIFVSAKTGEGLDDIFAVTQQVNSEFTRKLDMKSLNKLVQEATTMRPPPSFKGQQLKVFQVRQKGTKPPSFIFQVNNTKLLHFSYRRYLENHIRKAFGLRGTPIDIILKKNS